MKKTLLIVGVLVGAAFLGYAIYSSKLRKQETSLSPESRVRYEDNDLELSVVYSRPSKKGREIFGGLVPYGKLWRTGANAATIFATSKDIVVNGNKVEAGRYQLVTIPNEDHWTVILNSDVPGWGINKGTGQVYHNPKTDVLRVDVPVTRQDSETEQFTIAIDQLAGGIVLSFTWDHTKVNVPVARQ